MTDLSPTTSLVNRDRIIRSAALLLREEGAAAVTTRAVADAARVQAPAIYRLFGDKDGLLDALAEHVMEQYVQTKARTPDDLDPVEGLRAGWRSQIEFSLANPELHRLLNTRSRASPATEAGIAILRHRVHRIAATGRLRVSEERAVEMIHAAGNGAIQSLLDVPSDERDAGLADAVLEAVVAGITRPVGSDDGSIDARTDFTSAAVAFATFIPDMPAVTDAERALLAEWVDRAIRSTQTR